MRSIELDREMTSNTGDYSGSDSDDGVDEDLEAYRRVCILTGTNPDDLRPSTAATPSIPLPNDNDDEDSESESLEDDLEFVRGLRQRFSIDEEPQPLCTILPDECEDDFQLLRVIEQRFSQYNANSASNSTGCSLQQHEQVGATNIDSEKESSNNLFVERTNNGEGFPDCVDASINTQNLGFTGNIDLEEPPSDSIEWHEPGAEIVAVSPDRSSSFPKSAQAFVDAIKKNRSCQKFIRMKMMQIETKMEENKKLRGRIKILKDFQVACRKRTGRALSRKKDARVQLISVPKLRANAKVDEKNPSAFYYGPAENAQVANYRMALERFPLIFNRAKWSKEEKENLTKGIKQQFQEMLLQKSVDFFSEADGDSSDFDSMIVSIRDHDITSEEIRLFLPKVNWEQVASMYVMGRTGAECESRWLNCEDPLINHSPWTKLEDKNLLHVVQQNDGISNWIDIAVSLGTNRTPFQCLARYQRSLNAKILKSEWSEDEDDKLRAAVAACGESNWQAVASAMEGRTGTQCSNRWTKSLNPMRQRVGRWSLDEDKRLKIAGMLFGAKNWHKIAQFIPGRTQVQCRERWVNCLDPSLNMSKWTEEEDSKLRAAILEHGYTSWSKVAACLAPRTDSQCRRRWAALHPEEVYLSQATRKIQKEALISNFVDRESERPALGPSDFIPLAIGSIPESEKMRLSRKRKRKRRPVPEHSENEPPSGCVPTRRSSRLRKGSRNSSDKVLRLIDEDEVGDGDVSKKKTERRRKSRSVNEKPAASTLDIPLSCPDEAPLPITYCEEVRAPGRDNSKKLTTKKKTPRVQKRKSREEEPKEANALSEVDDISNLRRNKPIPRGNSSSPTSIDVEPCSCTTSPDLPDLSENLPSHEKRLETYVGPHEDIDVQGCGINEERPLRCSTPDIIDCLNSRSSDGPRPIRRKKSKAKEDKSCSKKKKKMVYENDMTLACFLEQRRKQRKPAFLSTPPNLGAISDIVECSQNLDLHPICPTSDIPENQNSDYACEQSSMLSIQKQAKDRKRSVFQMSETNDEDDMTLASWMSKLKKRKLK